ncbi:hypothetical protein A2996_01500 [Candidatus Campbellbacteria bacterium RIFCSPLOWO2_01_FULL_34_15]|uniref:Uncharacterized protein n=1 Tax=Candidatus Campbellbacteria bacterium RIFCSPLOWO2_01_FULL_34_15 TaxID=1797579 RepID=A0A1F5EPE6_9BACT|nr:MAG: hypothetical protein A2996_01500 [Candidatus Campbellbacteria bacterium RIFCSPLOWO2_01_FULL_34_15]
MRISLSKIYSLGLWGILSIPVLAKAWSPLNPSIVPNCARTQSASPDGCHWSDLIILMDTILDVFIWLSIPIATILFAWIGWTLIVEGNKSSAVSAARGRIVSLIKGMFFILASWLIVKLIVSVLAKPEYYQDFLN